MLFASGVVVMTDSVIPADNKPGQSPLPAFFYGGGDTGSGAMADASAALPVPIDRRTLLGLVAGTGMLASVLFAGGVLIGASMFMSTPQEAAFAETGADPVPQDILIAPPPAETLRQQAVGRMSMMPPRQFAPIKPPLDRRIWAGSVARSFPHRPRPSLNRRAGLNRK